MTRISAKALHRLYAGGKALGAAEAARGLPPRPAPPYGYMDGYGGEGEKPPPLPEAPPRGEDSFASGAGATIELRGKVHLVNAALRGSWQSTAAETSRVREEASLLWREALRGEALPPPVEIRVLHMFSSRRPPDTGASFLAAKAAVDGLVDAGGIKDDSPLHISSICFIAPRRAASPSLIIRAIPIREIGAGGR